MPSRKKGIENQAYAPMAIHMNADRARMWQKCTLAGRVDFHG